MNSIVLKAISRSRGGFILSPRLAFALHKTQYQAIISPKPVRQPLSQMPHTRNFTTTSALAKRGNSPKGSKPGKPYANDNRDRGAPKDTAMPRKEDGGKGMKEHYTADWNDGDKPDVHKWCVRMDLIAFKTMSERYEEVEKAVMEWMDLLNSGVDAGIPDARIRATVRRNRLSSAALMEWVTEVPDADDMGLWPSEPGLNFSGTDVDEDIDIEEKRKERDKLRIERELIDEEELIDDQNLIDKLDNEYEQYRREAIGPKYDTLSEEERDRAIETWESLVDENECEQYQRLVLGPKYDTMGERERARAMEEWEEEKINRDMVGPKWDTMSNEERKLELKELQYANGEYMFGPEWNEMSEEERDQVMTEFTEREIEEDDELEGLDPEEGVDHRDGESGKPEKFGKEKREYQGKNRPW